MFGNDGVVYKETANLKTNFNFVTTTDIEQAITNTIEPHLDRKVYNYYLENFTKILAADLELSGQVQHKILTEAQVILMMQTARFKVAGFTANNLRFLEAGTLVKFVVPLDYFMTTNKNNLMSTVM